MELSTDKFNRKYMKSDFINSKCFLKHFSMMSSRGVWIIILLWQLDHFQLSYWFLLFLFLNHSENKDFEIDPKLNITQMSGGLRVHWQHTKDYSEKSLENKDQTEFINLKAHSSGKMQQVLFILYQQVFSVFFAFNKIHLQGHSVLE